MSDQADRTEAQPDGAVPATREMIASAAGVELPARPAERPVSVLEAQALAIKATVQSLAKVVNIANDAIKSGEPLTAPAIGFILTAALAQLDAADVQCDSFLVMARAMSAAVRPAAPDSTTRPSVFGGAKQ